MGYSMVNKEACHQLLTIPLSNKADNLNFRVFTITFNRIKSEFVQMRYSFEPVLKLFIYFWTS